MFLNGKRERKMILMKCEIKKEKKENKNENKSLKSKNREIY
jgi:hypothetical protein